jgi:2-keto-4-pentenoate hydratase
MASTLNAAIPAALAHCRRSGTVSQQPLHELASRADAEAFQAAAIKALGGEPCGYKIGATSADVQKFLGCGGPMYAPVLRQHMFASGARFAIPDGLLGIECEFGFEMAHDFPQPGEPVTLDRLRTAIADCFAALEVVGRRVDDQVALNEVSSIADFGLDVAVVRGASVPRWNERDLSTMRVAAVLDGAIITNGSGAMVLGNPLNALLWLAQQLHARGDCLCSGDIIVTGTCTGITKVVPGQSFEGRFADLAPVCLELE